MEGKAEVIFEALAIPELEGLIIRTNDRNLKIKGHEQVSLVYKWLRRSRTPRCLARPTLGT